MRSVCKCLKGFCRNHSNEYLLLKAAEIGPFVGGGSEIAENALHACLLLVVREDLEPENKVALGCGSIVSRSRIITAAHVVEDATVVQAGYYNRRIVAANLRRADSIYVQPIRGFDILTFESDLAIVVFEENSFPIGNVIPIAAATPTAGEAFLAGYGFQNATAEEPSLLPLLAPHTVLAECPEAINGTETHFCAAATAPAVIFPGDNGAGLYTGTGRDLQLVSCK